MTSTLPPFQSLVDAHSRDVLRLLVRLVGLNDAEDCLQETLLAALRAYPSLAHGTNLRGWLMTIARNKARDLHRRASPPTAPLPASVADAALSSANDSDEWAHVAALPAKQRDAVVLRYGRDMSYADVAIAMAISREAARRNAHEGIKKLRGMRHER